MELAPLTIALIVFVLACFIGYHVIWGVTPSLHTPLMAVTNAISGIVIVAAILVAGPQISDLMCDDYDCYAAIEPFARLVKNLGGLGIVLASINIFGGFVVTARMLAMFKKKEK